MYPHARTLVKKLADKPFALIGVNSDSDRDKIKAIIEEKNITWRSFWNGPGGTSGPISKRWQVRGWPTLYVLDAEGVIRYKGHRSDEMDEAIMTVLGEMGHEVSIVRQDEEDEEEKNEADSEDEEEAEEKEAEKKEAAEEKEEDE